MTVLIIVIVAVLALQVALFVITRTKIKKERADSIVEKYDIRSSGDAWRLLNDPEIPEEDRIKIEKLYQGKEE